MNIKPYISVITVTLNAEQHIENCLLSVINQDYPYKEHWIIDGYSTDNTTKIVKSYAEKFNHIKYLSEKDHGIYDAMNKGIKVSKGKWLYFLGADDILFDNTVFSSIFNKKNNPFLDVIYGNVIFKNSKNRYDGQFNNQKLIKKNICHQAIFYKKSIFKKIGNYDIRYKALADYAFNMKWFPNIFIRRKYINRVIAVYNETGFSVNHTDKKFAEDKDLLVEKYFYWYFKSDKLKRFLYKFHF
jgi:glycosyltransferase involved in cell wall biosynthesis